MSYPPQNQPYPATGQPGGVADNPGRVWGIVGFILAFFPFLSVVGVILSIVGLVKSRKAGQKNGLAIAGIIIGTLVTIGTILLFIGIVALAGAGAELVELCANSAGETVEYQGQPFECPVLPTS
jgi:hypothetical protein